MKKVTDTPALNFYDILTFCSGEDVFISLCGSCEELDIHLEPECVTLKRTYIGLTNVHTVSLTNSSDTALQYCWTMWPIQEVEEQSLPGYTCRPKAFLMS